MKGLLPFAGAIALPLAFTAAIAGAVAVNRGETREQIVVTEQEVSVEGGRDANSGARLWLSWSDEGQEGRWSSCEMVRRVGFACSGRGSLRDARQLPRYAFVALSLDGARANRSRLVPIDADRDGDALRRRYRDTAKYLVVPAIVAVVRVAPSGAVPYTSVVVQTIDPRAVQVPTELRASVPSRELDSSTPPIRVTLRYGRRWEPWVADLR
jgi:hypothetical protein